MEVKVAGAAVVSSKSCTKEELRIIRSSIRRCEGFFKKKSKSLLIVICRTREEWKKHSAEYFFEIAKGVVLRDGTIVVKSSTQAKVTLAKWEKILTHEIVHSYWVTLRGYQPRWEPIWLAEGLACFVAQNDFLLSEREIGRAKKKGAVLPRLPYRYRASLFSGRAEVVLLYSGWGRFVGFLFCYHKDKLGALLQVLATFSTKASFERHFAQLFGEKPERSYARWLESL